MAKDTVLIAVDVLQKCSCFFFSVLVQRPLFWNCQVLNANILSVCVCRIERGWEGWGKNTQSKFCVLQVRESSIAPYPSIPKCTLTLV